MENMELLVSRLCISVIFLGMVQILYIYIWILSIKGANCRMILLEECAEIRTDMIKQLRKKCRDGSRCNARVY